MDSLSEVSLIDYKFSISFVFQCSFYDRHNKPLITRCTFHLCISITLRKPVKRFRSVICLSKYEAYTWLSYGWNYWESLSRSRRHILDGIGSEVSGVFF